MAETERRTVLDFGDLILDLRERPEWPRESIATAPRDRITCSSDPAVGLSEIALLQYHWRYKSYCDQFGPEITWIDFVRVSELALKRGLAHEE